MSDTLFPVLLPPSGVAVGSADALSQKGALQAQSSHQAQQSQKDVENWQQALKTEENQPVSKSAKPGEAFSHPASSAMPSFSDRLGGFSPNGQKGVRSTRAGSIEAGNSQSGFASGIAARTPKSGSGKSPVQAFEAMTISFLLKEAFKDDIGKAFGDGMSADFYTSLFSDAVAEEISKAGGLGIGDLLEQTGAKNRVSNNSAANRIGNDANFKVNGSR